MPIKDPTSRRDYFRNYMRKRRGKPTGAQVKPGVKPKGAPDKAAAEHIAALEAEVARLKAAAEPQQQQPRERPRTAADLLARKAQVTAAIAAKRAEAKAARLAAAAAERPDADVPTLLAENDALKQQLKAAQTANRNLRTKFRLVEQSFHQARQGQYMPPELRKVIRKHLHPDQYTDPAMKRRYDQLNQEFNQHFGDRQK